MREAVLIGAYTNTIEKRINFSRDNIRLEEI